MDLYNVETPLTHDVWIVGNGQVETTTVTLKSGEDIAAREVLAVEVATGKVVTYDESATAGTGPEVAKYIAVYAVDATAGDVEAEVYKAGQFNEALAVWSGTPTALQKSNQFRGTPISLETLRA